MTANEILEKLLEQRKKSKGKNVTLVDLISLIKVRDKRLHLN